MVSVQRTCGNRADPANLFRRVPNNAGHRFLSLYCDCGCGFSGTMCQSFVAARDLPVRAGKCSIHRVGFHPGRCPRLFLSCAFLCALCSSQTSDSAKPCMEPPPMVRWQDYDGPFEKVVGAFGQTLDRESVQPPRYKPGTALCSLELRDKFLLFVHDSYEPISFLSIFCASSGLKSPTNSRCPSAICGGRRTLRTGPPVPDPDHLLRNRFPVRREMLCRAPRERLHCKCRIARAARPHHRPA